MPHYFALYIALIIFAVTGVLDSILCRAELTRSEFAYAFLAALALSPFTVNPWTGFRVDLAALAVPFALLLISRGKSRDTGAALTLAVAALLPIAAAAMVTLYDLIFYTYAAYELAAESACIAEAALVLLASLSTLAKKKRARE